MEKILDDGFVVHSNESDEEEPEAEQLAASL